MRHFPQNISYSLYEHCKSHDPSEKECRITRAKINSLFYGLADKVHHMEYSYRCMNAELKQLISLRSENAGDDEPQSIQPRDLWL